MQNTSADSNKSLLVVDDEEFFLKILERIFSKHFIIKTATCGTEALEILQKGFAPGVIMSDQRMPEMTGAEFLAESMNYAPDAVRIILTGFNNPKDIIACINQGHAFMYITKPADDIQLIQAVRIAFDHYEINTRNKRLNLQLSNKINELKAQIEQYKILENESKNQIMQSVQGFAGLITMSEKFYFTNHVQSVTLIAKALAVELHLPTDSINQIVIASLIHNTTLIGMPHHLALSDPFELEFQQQLDYFEYFNKALTVLSKVKSLEKAVKIVFQIWEHNDGTGLPSKLAGSNIMKEAHIVSFANQYHNRVYRATPDMLSVLYEKGEITQTKETTFAKHSEAIKYFYRRANWLDMDVANTFHDLAKRRACPALIPEANNLVLKYRELYREAKPAQEFIVTPDGQHADEIKIDLNRRDKQANEKEIPISELSSGMKLAQNIVTKNGMLIARQDTVLDQNLTKNIQSLENTGMVFGSISIYVTQGE